MTSGPPSLIGATFLWLTTYGCNISLVFDMCHLQTFEACFCCSRFSSLSLQNGKGPWGPWDLWIHLAKMSNSKGVVSWFSWQIIWDVSIVATPVAQHPWLAWPCCICAAIWAVWHHESRVAGPVPPRFFYKRSLKNFSTCLENFTVCTVYPWQDLLSKIGVFELLNLSSNSHGIRWYGKLSYLTILNSILPLHLCDHLIMDTASTTFGLWRRRLVIQLAAWSLSALCSTVLSWWNA